jgi:ferredoxin
MEKAIVKFNGGALALLCSSCRVIIKTGKDFTPEEMEFTLNDKHLDPQYCEKCNNLSLEKQVNT